MGDREATWTGIVSHHHTSDFIISLLCGLELMCWGVYSLMGYQSPSLDPAEVYEWIPAFYFAGSDISPSDCYSR